MSFLKENSDYVGLSIHVCRIGEIDTQSDDQSFRCHFKLKFLLKPFTEEIEVKMIFYVIELMPECSKPSLN